MMAAVSFEQSALVQTGVVTDAAAGSQKVTIKQHQQFNQWLNYNMNSLTSKKHDMSVQLGELYCHCQTADEKKDSRYKEGLGPSEVALRATSPDP